VSKHLNEKADPSTVTTSISQPTTRELKSIIADLRKEITTNNLLLEQVVVRLQQIEAEKPSWAPPSFPSSLPGELLNSPRVTLISRPERNPLPIIFKMKSTLLGKYYVKNLKKYSVMRGLVNWTWRECYPIYAKYGADRLGFRPTRGWRPLIQLGEFAKSKGLSVVNLVPLSSIETPTPQVFPECDQRYLSPERDCYDFPPIYSTTISNGTVCGGTNLVLAEDKVICHDLYDFNRDYTSEELHGRTVINPRRNRIRWLLHDDKPETIQVGASFVDSCAENYAHWISEVLPRIALFCSEERFHGIPIIVNAGLHKNIMSSLFLLAGDRHEIKALPIGRALIVEELHLISVTGYVPFGQRTNRLSGHSHGKFSPSVLKLLSDSIHTFVRQDTEDRWPKKIYIRRQAGLRRVTNEKELEMELAERGYVAVEPGVLTFLQQINLFRNAKVILATTGAALSNAVFCMPGTQVAILMAKHEQMIYRYWCDMLVPTGIDVSYVLGEIIENTDLGIHADFSVDMDDIRHLLNAMEPT